MVYQVLYILAFEPSLDASSLRPGVIRSINILSLHLPLRVEGAGLLRIVSLLGDI